MSPDEIVGKMMAADRFSQWMGMKVVDLTAGSCILELTVTEEMTNGFNIAHGGITYSLSDSAMAFASNAHGNHAVSIGTQINHLVKVQKKDVLRAECRETHRSRSLGLYECRVSNQDGQLVAVFSGQVKFLSTYWQ